MGDGVTLLHQARELFSVAFGLQQFCQHLGRVARVGIWVECVFNRAEIFAVPVQVYLKTANVKILDTLRQQVVCMINGLLLIIKPTALPLLIYRPRPGRYNAKL